MKKETKKFLSYLFWIGIACLYGVMAAYFSSGLALSFCDKTRYFFADSGVYKYQAESQSGGIAQNYFPPDKKSAEISMIFTGDIMLDRGVKNSARKNGSGDFSFIFQNADFLKEADIVFGNMEGPLAESGTESGNLFSFRMEPSVFAVLRQSGFNVFSIANNHMGDWGREALEETIFRLKNENIAAVGAGWNKDDAQKIKTIEKDGIKIGFLGFSDVGPKWLEAKETASGILLVDENFKKIITDASKETDYLVVSIHFGEEYQKEPTERQKNLGRAAIDAGAKIVIGHHPHVIQPVENYSNGVIAYSLGNFVFDQNFSEETMDGLVLEIVLDKKGILQVNAKTARLNEFFQPSLFKTYR